MTGRPSSGALPGILYGVGVGPGDPELLTMKAHRILNEAPVWAVPTSYADAGSMALEVLGPLREAREREGRAPDIVSLLFPMTRDESLLSEARKKNAETLLGALSRGDAAFVALGDILFYSTFGNLLSGLHPLAPALRVEVVPGITAYAAGVAKLVEPLTQGSERLAVLPAVYAPEEIEKALDLFEVVVFMKINKVFPAVREILSRRGLLDRTAYLSSVGMPGERIERHLDRVAPEEVPYMSLLVVRKNGWMVR